MKSLKSFSLAALVIVLLLVACGGDGATSGEPKAGTSPTSETTSSQAASAPTADVDAPAAQAPEQAAEEDLQLDSVSEGLAQLRSYKSNLAMRFTGKDAQGQAVDRTWTMHEEFIQEPPAQRVMWESSESVGGESPPTSFYETITLGDSWYMIGREADGTETCYSMTSQTEATQPESFLSADMWGTVSDARYEGTETVNGVRAKHYSWKEGTLVTFGYSGGKADTWVAVDGGYVVKQRIEATGKGLFLGAAEEEGTSLWEWDVTEINGSFQIEPPAGCESGVKELPVLADATDKATFGDTLTYTTATPFAEVVAFYKTEMPKAGWEPSGTPTEMDTFVTLDFTQDGRSVSFWISFDEDAKTTSVFATVAEQ